MTFRVSQSVPFVVDLSGLVGDTVVNGLPFEPELTAPFDVTLVHGGVGNLERVTGTPGPGQFKLEGATNRDIVFGTVPDPSNGETVSGTQVVKF